MLKLIGAEELPERTGLPFTVIAAVALAAVGVREMLLAE
jgi:hypothetical protein